MTERSRSLFNALAALVLALAAPATGRAELVGIVFVDANANGARDPGEVGRPDVAVTNGREVVRTDAQGAYRLPEREGFVYLTRPDGFRCDTWYRSGAGGFALVPEHGQDEFFFIQVSDPHVYDRKSDFRETSRPVPWWVPQFVVDWLTVRQLHQTYADDVIDRLREAVSPRVDSSELGDVDALRAYQAEFARDESELGDVIRATRAAMAEVKALRPAFVISTGDLVLESNTGSAEAIERWFNFYRELTADGVDRYQTIGNNEIAGSENPDFSPTDPRYGKYFFEQHFGPTYYSFDRGPFHFVALDTHRFTPGDDGAETWDINRMEADVAAWLDADLAAHADRVLVVLNHEPFHFDDAWPFEQDSSQTADDEGLFEKHSVSWVLTGHTHFNSFKPGEPAHITTGALSGQRWVLPPAVHERGYRLFYARDRRLFSGWKQTGQILLARSEGTRVPGQVVLVAADRAGPFPSLRVERGGTPLEVERWGDYFARVRVDGGGTLVVTATRTDRSTERAEMGF
jgi:3',5'-cyclic AMP phosphodiesterase CpdA